MKLKDNVKIEVEEELWREIDGIIILNTIAANTIAANNKRWKVSCYTFREITFEQIKLADNGISLVSTEYWITFESNNKIFVTGTAYIKDIIELSKLVEEIK